MKPAMLHAASMRYDSVESVVTERRFGTRKTSPNTKDMPMPRYPATMFLLFSSLRAVLKADADVNA